MVLHALKLCMHIRVIHMNHLASSVCRSAILANSCGGCLVCVLLTLLAILNDLLAVEVLQATAGPGQERPRRLLLGSRYGGHPSHSL